jgi:hypothetical protein
MPPAGFEPTIPAGDGLLKHALDRSATGIGKNCNIPYLLCDLLERSHEALHRLDRRKINNLFALLRNWRRFPQMLTLLYNSETI